MVWPMPEMAQMAWSTRDQPEAPRSWPFASDQGGGTKKHRLVKLCVHKSSDAWFGQCQKWHRWPVPPETSQRPLDHGLFSSDQGGGTKKSRLVKLCVHKSSYAWLVETARKCFCQGTGIQISPLPILFVKRKFKYSTYFS